MDFFSFPALARTVLKLGWRIDFFTQSCTVQTSRPFLGTPPNTKGWLRKCIKRPYSNRGYALVISRLTFYPLWTLRGTAGFDHKRNFPVEGQIHPVPEPGLSSGLEWTSIFTLFACICYTLEKVLMCSTLDVKWVTMSQTSNLPSCCLWASSKCQWRELGQVLQSKEKTQMSWHSPA